MTQNERLEINQENKNQTNSKRINRRNFLRANAAIAVGATGIGVIAATQPAAAQTNEETLQNMIAQTDKGGILVSDENNALYFVPAEVLEKYRLSKKNSQEVLEYINPKGAVSLVSALRGPNVKRWGLAASDTTTVSVANTAAIRRSVR